MKYFISYGFDDAKTFWGRKYYFVSCYVSEHQQVIIQSIFGLSFKPKNL
jgi:hypothetical protein